MTPTLSFRPCARARLMGPSVLNAAAAATAVSALLHWRRCMKSPSLAGAILIGLALQPALGFFLRNEAPHLEAETPGFHDRRVVYGDQGGALRDEREPEVGRYAGERERAQRVAAGEVIERIEGGQADHQHAAALAHEAHIRERAVADRKS